VVAYSALITSFARRMIRRQDRQRRRWSLAWLAAICIVLAGLALNGQAGAGGDPSAPSLARSAAGPTIEIDRHHGAPYGGGEHCLAGPGCASAGASPEAAVLWIGANIPGLVRADVFTHQRHIRPPLHPPNAAVQG
jgi:hypothetical protein